MRRSCRASTRRSAAPTTSSGSSTCCAPQDLVPLDREAEQAYLFRHVAARRPWPTRACRSSSGRRSTSASPRTSSGPRPATRSPPRPARPPLLEQPQRREEARVPRRAPADAAQAAVRERGRDRLLRTAGAACRRRRARRGAPASSAASWSSSATGRARTRSIARHWRWPASSTIRVPRAGRDVARRGRPQAGPLRRGRRAARLGAARFRAPTTKPASARSCTSPGTIAAQRGDYDAGPDPIRGEPRDPRAPWRPREPGLAVLQPWRSSPSTGRLRRDARRLNQRGARIRPRSAIAGRSASPRTISG